MSEKLSKAEIRRQILQNGYVPLPGNDKAVYLKQWTKVKVDEAMIADWDRATHSTAGAGTNTAIRTDGLATIDIDCYSEVLVEEVLRLARDMLGPPMCVRMGQPPKIMILYSLGAKKGKGKPQTGKWLDKETKQKHQVEIQMGRGLEIMAYGIHPDTRKPYQWTPKHPLNTPRSALPVVNAGQIDDFKRKCIQLFKHHGLLYTRGEKGSFGDEYPKKHDLMPDTEVHVVSPADWEDTYLIGELEEALAGVTDEDFVVRVHMGTSDNHADSGFAGLCRDGYLRVLDFADGHCHLRPPEDRAVKVAEELAVLQEEKEKFFAELLRDWVFVSSENAYFRTDSPHRAHVETAMRRRTRGWKIDGDDMLVAWLKDPEFKLAEAREFAPHEPDTRLVQRPAGLFLNSYQRPEWYGTPAADDAKLQLWHDFMGHLLPVTSEREGFLDWLANKVQHPRQRMYGVMMVAERFGTGRGTLSQILSRLFGPKYAIEVDWQKFMGRGSQGQFFDWLYESLMVMVPEVFNSSKRWHDRVAAYERIKLLVDPGRGSRNMNLKYGHTVDAEIYASVLLSTNHMDAVAVVENDRRLSILQNGDIMTPAMRKAIHGSGGRGGWLADDHNVAALDAWLRARVPSVDLFDAPALSDAKQQMIEAAKSDIDVAWDLFVDATGAQAFTVDQFRRFCFELASISDSEAPDALEDALQSGFFRHKGLKTDRARQRIRLNGKVARYVALSELPREQVRHEVDNLERLLTRDVATLRRNLTGGGE